MTTIITDGGFIKDILRGVRCTKSLRVLFLHRRPPSWTTLVLYSRAVFIFNEPALTITNLGRDIDPKGVDLSTTIHIGRSGWKQPDIAVKVDTDRHDSKQAG
jgi:hypothetical protein